MLTYRVRRRVIRLDQEVTLGFPCDTVIRFHLLPEQPFGLSASGGRTAIRAVGAVVLFNANSGRHTIVSGRPLKPLDIAIESSPPRDVALDGRVLELRASFESLDDLARTAESISFALPWLLTVSFADPPFVERVDGEISGVPFRWELADWKMGFETTTQEEQGQAVIDAWERLELLLAPGRRRLLAALHYLHVACRLERESETPGEFIAEVLLNLSKTLEVLFPGPKTIDAARAGLAELGYTTTEIEARFIPVLALRNQIDVGHVHLAVFKRSQLSVLHSYVESSERHFRQLLERVISRIESGTWDVPEYEPESPRPEALEVINRMAKALGAETATDRKK